MRVGHVLVRTYCRAPNTWVTTISRKGSRYRPGSGISPSLPTGAGRRHTSQFDSENLPLVSSRSVTIA